MAQRDRVLYRYLNWVFGTIVLTGAFLLFLLQPLISKFILPWFGGSPAVWTTCMLFFQSTLCLGYLYGHWLQQRFAPLKQVLIHASLVVAAGLTLPIDPDPNSRLLATTAPVVLILVLLGTSVGLTFFLLSATSPLVQSWFGHTNPRENPYRLYSLSNLGSLIGLVSYPFFIEPSLTLTAQSRLWSVLFLLYAALCLICGGLMISCRRLPKVERATGDSLDGCGNFIRPSIRQRILWLFLPACSSLMLLATTNKVCQDIAAVPFLWVMPLALYLLSYIICFHHNRWYLRTFWTMASAGVLVFLSAYECTLRFDFFFSVTEELVLYFAALFLICMVCHGELSRLKPDARFLTGFYLALSIGGAIGGLLVAIVAPLVFSSFLEWGIGLFLSYGLATGALISAVGRSGWRLAVQSAIVVLALTGLLHMVRWSGETVQVVERVRNFYGVISVSQVEFDDPDADELVMRHGKIVHGQQFVAPWKRDLPTAYYGYDSGIGKTLLYLRSKSDLRVGLIGLGAGTLAAYSRPGDEYRFYEINPEVVRLAQKYFNYLSSCKGKCDVVLGDARLSLESEPPQNFDVLVLDAFSGDAIPAHLLTSEAFRIYEKHLSPDGILAVHTTNKHLRLTPVVRALADHHGLKIVRIHSGDDDSRLICEAEWMLLTKNQAFLREVPPVMPKEERDDFEVPLWTDHYSSLYRILED